LASGVVKADGTHVRVLGVFRNVLPKDVALRSWGYCLELGLEKGRGPGPAYELCRLALFSVTRRMDGPLDALCVEEQSVCWRSNSSFISTSREYTVALSREASPWRYLATSRGKRS